LSGASDRPRRPRGLLPALRALEQAYPDATTALEYSTPWQLLVATVLSAQCTDRRVNLITARLFRDCPDAVSLSRLSLEELEDRIRDCGLFHAKARHLYAASHQVAERWGADLPPSISRADLEALPGVGRKTASVVLANAYGVPALAVDTHVFRVSHRLGWSDARDPDHTADDLMRLIPRTKWAAAHHWLIYHGRRVCHARRPDCSNCPVERWCPRVGVVTHGPPVRVRSGSAPAAPPAPRGG
jgi:endonuclease-3